MRYRLDHNIDCYLAAHGHMEKGDPVPPCEGRLVRCHLIDQQLLNKMGLETGDPDTYVLGCGGMTGLTGHHGMLDTSKRLRLRVEDLPAEVLDFAARHNLMPWLEKKYGEPRS